MGLTNRKKRKLRIDLSKSALWFIGCQAALSLTSVRGDNFSKQCRCHVNTRLIFGPTLNIPKYFDLKCCFKKRTR